MTALSLAATAAYRPPRIVDEYLDRTPCSRELFTRSATLFPSGITHDSRQLDPYPIYVERAAGPLKWDVDGHEYVDYVGGHGALILGHNDRDVTMAATDQLAKGTHYGASHQLEVEWGEEIRRLVPSAERIRFTNSGTEATLLGLRLARAATGKPRVLRPDLTSFAKIVAGGFPGAAIVGRKDLLDPLDYEVMKQRGSEKVRHQGTFNANPVCAAAGAAALRKIGSTDACARANATGAKLREALNAVLEEEGVPWALYGPFSAFHIFTNPKGREIMPARFDAFACPADELRGNDPTTLTALRLALLVEGIDIAGWPGGMISATHDDGCVERTIAGFRSALHSLKKDNVLPA